MVAPSGVKASPARLRILCDVNHVNAFDSLRQPPNVVLIIETIQPLDAGKKPCVTVNLESTVPARVFWNDCYLTDT